MPVSNHALHVAAQHRPRETTCEHPASGHRSGMQRARAYLLRFLILAALLVAVMESNDNASSCVGSREWPVG